MDIRIEYRMFLRTAGSHTEMVTTELVSIFAIRGFTDTMMEPVHRLVTKMLLLLSKQPYVECLHHKKVDMAEVDRRISICL